MTEEEDGEFGCEEGIRWCLWEQGMGLASCVDHVCGITVGPSCEDCESLEPGYVYWQSDLAMTSPQPQIRLTEVLPPLERRSDEFTTKG